MRKEIILSGSGGQGLILAGIVLAEAALLAGLQAVQTQSYGPEARGGASRSEVIIGDGEIDYPKVERADLLLAMNQEACDKFIGAVKETGLAVVDSTYVSELPAVAFRVVSLPITQATKERLGKAIVANMAALGALVYFLEEVPLALAEQAIAQRVPRGTEEINRQAFRLGRELAEEYFLAGR